MEMAKFTVRRYQDAYVIQEAEIEAHNAEAAAREAYNDDNIKWGEPITQTDSARVCVSVGIQASATFAGIVTCFCQSY
jgi:hypothetical protein